MRGRGGSKSGVKNPSVKIALGSVCPLLLTKGEKVYWAYSNPRGKKSLPGSLWGPLGIKHELAEKGGSEGLALHSGTRFHSYPRAPNPTAARTTSPTIPQNCLSPFTPGNWSQTLKETPKALFPPHAGKRSCPLGATQASDPAVPYKEVGLEVPTSTPDDQI